MESLEGLAEQLTSWTGVSPSVLGHNADSGDQGNRVCRFHTRLEGGYSLEKLSQCSLNSPRA